MSMTYEQLMQQSVQNMVSKIKENKMTEEFLMFNPCQNEGYMWSRSPIIDKLNNLVDSDGHSGASFAICCRMAYEILEKPDAPPSV